MTTDWYLAPCATPSKAAQTAAQTRQQNLTKPAGSLGRLETIAEQFAAWQQTPHPTLDKVAVRVFAADHGICAQNISAFPQAVTAQMVMNFLTGGAAISVLSNAIKADFAVVTAGLATPLPAQHHLPQQQLIQADIANGTADFSQQAAMTAEQMQQALAIGKNIITAAPDMQLFIGGEMGIGNTTSASAIYASLLNLSPEKTCGPGTGINAAGVKHKANIIKQALAQHQPTSTIETLQTLGGFEIAALAGAYICAAQQGIPSLIDGFICTAAALVATRLNPACRDWLMFSHCSAEPAHRLALAELAAQPLLDIGMRLGEGSGAAIAFPLIKHALLLHNQMATFAEAAVADQKPPSGASLDNA